MQRITSEFDVPGLAVEGLDMAPGETLVSLEGNVWVTASDRAADIILGPGDALTFAKRARAVVGGLSGRGVRVKVNPVVAH